MDQRVRRAPAARTSSGAPPPTGIALASLIGPSSPTGLSSSPLHARLWSRAQRTQFPPMTQADPILAVDKLTVRFHTHDGMVDAVRGVSLRVGRSECLGVVGESGSGKSQTFMAVMGLLAQNGRAEGSARFQGQELIDLNRRALNGLRGSKMTMIFQDPLTALTPHVTIGEQIAEPLRAHLGLSAKAAMAHAQ